jgi:DNA topoisomerase-1
MKEATGNDFTAKDFRTWAGSLTILSCFKNLGQCQEESQIKKNIVSAIDEVSLKLGNTRTVCRKYYVHPGIVKLYEEQSLDKYLKDLEVSDEEESIELTSDEKVLMRILKRL